MDDAVPLAGAAGAAEPLWRGAWQPCAPLRKALCLRADAVDCGAAVASMLKRCELCGASGGCASVAAMHLTCSRCSELLPQCAWHIVYRRAAAVVAALHESCALLCVVSCATVVAFLLWTPLHI